MKDCLMKVSSLPATFKKMINPSIDYVSTKARVKFNGDSSKQKKLHLIMKK